MQYYQALQPCSNICRHVCHCVHSVKSSESSLSGLSRKSGGNSVSSESKESVERIVTSENSENNVNCETNLGSVASSMGTNGIFSFFCCNTFFYKWNEVSVTVLKLDISFLPGFVALDLFGFVETPLFDFFSGFALFLFRFLSFDAADLFELLINVSYLAFLQCTEKFKR